MYRWGGSKRFFFNRKNVTSKYRNNKIENNYLLPL